jgi:hypothetical protein
MFEKFFGKKDNPAEETSPADVSQAPGFKRYMALEFGIENNQFVAKPLFVEGHTIMDTPPMIYLAVRTSAENAWGLTNKAFAEIAKHPGPEGEIMLRKLVFVDVLTKDHAGDPMGATHAIEEMVAGAGKKDHLPEYA